MRYLVSLAACAAVRAPSAAWAEDPCSRTPADLLPGFGAPAGNPEDGRTAYMPTGLTMLGREVSYVLVMRQGGDGPIEEVSYRLKDATRKIGSPPDGALSKAFDDAFYGGSCTKSKNSSCGVAYDPAKSEGLSGAELNSGSLWLEDKVTGPAIPLIRADLNLPDAAPIFLVCVYEPD